MYISGSRRKKTYKPVIPILILSMDFSFLAGEYKVFWIMYIHNFYFYILGEFPDALHESSAIYWKPTPFITHLLLLWWLFSNAVQIFWKNTTRKFWRNWSQKMCKKMWTYFHWCSESKTVQNFQNLILAAAVFCLKEL